MITLHTDSEHFCDVEQNAFPNSAFGIDEEGLVIHIKTDPVGNKPGTGHTLHGWDVWFHGVPSQTGGMWKLTMVSERS